jgi:hypothetical protein
MICSKREGAEQYVTYSLSTPALRHPRRGRRTNVRARIHKDTLIYDMRHEKNRVDGTDETGKVETMLDNGTGCEERKE